MNYKGDRMEKKLKVNFIFNTLKTIMVVAFPIVSFPYISRVLGVEGIGKFQYCYSVINYFILFASLGISSYAIRECARFRDDKEKFSIFVKEIFTINIITTIGAYVVLAFCFLAGAYEGKREIMLALSLSIIGTTLCIDWLYQALEQYVYISIRTFIIQLLSLILMFAFVKTEKDLLIYTFIFVFSSKGYCFLNLFNARRYVDFTIKCKLELKKHLKPILIIFGATISVSIYMNMDVVMLGMFCGDYEVGLYSAAVKVNTVIKNIITSISVVLLPRLASYLAKDQTEKFEQLFKQGAEINLFFSVASAMGLFVLSKPIILLFSGKEFLPAVLTGQILAVRLVFSALDNIFYNQVLIPTGHEKEACIGTAAGAVTNLVLNAILIPLLKTDGAAIATVVAEGVVFVYFIMTTRKIINLRNVLSSLPHFLVAAAIMGIAVWCGTKCIESVILQLIILIPTGAIIYFGVLFGIKRLLKKGNI